MSLERSIRHRPSYVVDVIIPVYGIGPVFVDTILSVFEQNTAELDIRCVVVVDGCPLVATNAGLLADLAGSNAFQLEVIHQKNAGVVAARNTAITHILKKANRSDFTLFLDGDDLLSPNYILASITAILHADTPAGKTIGWAYSDQFHFGDVVHWVQYPIKMWAARFAHNNFSQPSSLMRTEILDRGHRFDLQFNLGIEDWDFWCSAVRDGYVGAFVPDSYVFYRRLIGGRSSFNRSNDGITRFRMAQKHALDSYEFIVNGDEMFPRFGVLQLDSGDRSLSKQLALSRQVQFGLTDTPDTTQSPTYDDKASAVKQFFSRLAVQMRYRMNGVMDGPFTPQLILTGATGKVSAFNHSHLFALEHLFAEDKDLTVVEVRIQNCGGVMLVATDRVFQRGGQLKTAPVAGVVQIREGGTLGWLRAPSKDPDIISNGFKKTSAVIWALLQSNAPQLMSRAQTGFVRNIVGTQLSVMSDFFDTSLGYLPLRHLPGEMPNTDRAGFVVPANGRGVSLDILDTLIAEQTAAGLVPYLVMIHSPTYEGHADTRADLISRFDPNRVIDLFDVLPKLANTVDQHYNGASLFNSQRKHINYLTGALSYFSTVVNFGQTPVTSALAGLKTSRRTTNIYVANTLNHRTNEIEHLCAFLTTYSLVIPPNQNWAIEALGLGVRRASILLPT